MPSKNNLDIHQRKPLQSNEDALGALKIEKAASRYYGWRELATRNITGGNENSVLHVVVSKALLNGKKIKQEMIAVGTQISDHHLVVVEIE